MSNLTVMKSPPEWDVAACWWENLFNASEDAQIVCHRDGTAERINAKAARLFKLNASLDEGVFSVFKILSAPADQKLARMLLAGGTRADTLCSVVTLRNGMRYSLMDVEVIPLGAGYTLIVFKDASRRLRLESHVNRLITAIDVTPDVFLVTDADLRISYVNPAFQSATGYTLEEVLGRSDEFLRAPGEQEKILAYREFVSQGREWIGEFVNVRSNGTSYLVEAVISPISDIAGRFMGYVACERDVSVRKQLQDALRAERDFVHSILQSLDGAIYALDCEFRVTHANDGWRRLPAEHGGIRFEGGPQIGRALLDCVPDAARRDELRLEFQEVLVTGMAKENHFQGADGRHWLVKISPWINSGQARGLICNVADQTQHHELQNHLFQSQKMEIIGTLAAGVAHDFNNLLQAIRGHTGLILRQAAPESPLRDNLEKIDIAAVRAAKITKQLLSFSRVSDERSTILDLNQIIREASQLARRTLRGNVVIELHPSPKPVCVKMDVTRASQALLNLCVNGQDAMPGGGCLSLTNTVVELPAELAARHQLAPGKPFARCSVRDTGGGIAPDVLPRIFQPFFTTKEKDKGTGLGLSIVQRAAEEAGGFVEVESVLGSGSTFHLYLPLAWEKSAPDIAPGLAPLAHCTGRVLVVDDVDLLRDFTRNFLEMTGLTVLVAGSGPQALKVLEESAEPVDLVFTDYNMPGMNGAELIAQIAARRPEMKFILASGFLNEATVASVGKYQAEILSKPYDMHDASEIVMQKLAAG